MSDLERHIFQIYTKHADSKTLAEARQQWMATAPGGVDEKSAQWAEAEQRVILSLLREFSGPQFPDDICGKFCMGKAAEFMAANTVEIARLRIQEMQFFAYAERQNARIADFKKAISGLVDWAGPIAGDSKLEDEQDYEERTVAFAEAMLADGEPDSLPEQHNALNTLAFNAQMAHALERRLQAARRQGMRDAAQEVLAMSKDPSTTILFKAIADAIEAAAEKTGPVLGAGEASIGPSREGWEQPKP